MQFRFRALDSVLHRARIRRFSVDQPEHDPRERHDPQGAHATAYDIPAVRVIGPQWLEQTRYAINATVGVETPDAFRPLLLEELKNRLHLQTHFEPRPFDVFILTATDTPTLERARGQRPRISVQHTKAQLQEATMKQLAGAVQNILGKPVIDETGLAGAVQSGVWLGRGSRGFRQSYFAHRFGLHLTPAKREMEALVVDRVRRDPSLVLLGEIGRVTRAAPRTCASRSATPSGFASAPRHRAGRQRVPAAFDGNPNSPILRSWRCLRVSGSRRPV